MLESQGEGGEIKMASSKISFRCIVCDLDTSSLCNLHKHQSLYHSAEELSLSSLTLQSFIYHKHYFQTLDSMSPAETCYFYPFCSKLALENDKTRCQQLSHGYEQVAVKTAQDPFVFSQLEEKTKVKKRNIPKKQEQLRRPFNTDNLHNPQKSLKAEIIPGNENAPAKTTNSHDVFLDSANGLCSDLMKLKSPQKLKRKRLTGKTERPRKGRENGRKVAVKPTRKPVITKDVGKVNELSQNSPPEDLQTLKIWASKTEESASDISSKTSSFETVQQIKLQSPTVPTDMINCENALIFNSEIGSFQWNPLSFIEKESEDDAVTSL